MCHPRWVWATLHSGDFFPHYPSFPAFLQDILTVSQEYPVGFLLEKGNTPLCFEEMLWQLHWAYDVASVLLAQSRCPLLVLLCVPIVLTGDDLLSLATLRVLSLPLMFCSLFPACLEISGFAVPADLFPA